MKTDNLSLRRALSLVAVLLMTFSVSCAGIPNPSYVLPDFCKEIDNTPFTTLSLSPDPTIVIPDDGKIMVMHGFGHAQLPSGKRYIKVEQSVPIPDSFNHATVFLNGWKVNYLGDDQHVLGLATLITKIKFSGERGNQKLTWNAAGVLRDDDFEEGYALVYYYTVIAWNDAALNLIIDHGGPDNFCNADTGLPYNSFLALSDGTTALGSFSSFIQNPGFPLNKPVAVLPRGYGFAWFGGDNHLLQTAYNLDHSEIFAEKGKIYSRNKNHVHTVGDLLTGMPAPLPTPASLVDSGFVSWNTYAIFKDNADQRYYLFSEIVSGMGGNDVGVIQPPFSFLPREAEGGGSSNGGVLTGTFVVENIPFKYAIPMLTGWELGYLTDDQHVKEVGITIDGWTYSYVNGAPGGTLRYQVSSILRDNDTWPAHYSNHKVTILGIVPVTGVAQTKAPDLVPFSPLGTNPAAFCRIEQDGKLLRVTVKNQGNDDAGPSKTTVIFGNMPFVLDTPPIPEGGSVDLLFKVPAGCFKPDCSFKISVDSANQLSEVDEGNNNANGGCIG